MRVSTDEFHDIVASAKALSFYWELCRDIPNITVIPSDKLPAILLRGRAKKLIETHPELAERYFINGYTGFIFQNRYGDPLSPHSVNRAIDRICAAYIEDETVLADQEGRNPVLIRHFSAHNLRHTFCTRFCENERNIKVIQEIMGHADIETTMNIYAEATKEKKKESFSNLEGKIKIS